MMPMENSTDVLNGKVAIVTGAGRGIGRAIALGFARAGATVCCAARTRSQIDDTAAQIERAGGKVYATVADVTEWESVQQLFATTASISGGVDIVVANAGANLDRSAIEHSNPDAWMATLNVNLLGVYHCAKAAIPYLKERGKGKIITIGSGMGHKGIPGNSAYCCSKAGVWMLTRVLAQELWEHNISVNELIPGPVATTMTDKDRGQGSVFQIDSEWRKTPEDVVPLALFLATQPAIGPTAQSFSLMRRDN